MLGQPTTPELAELVRVVETPTAIVRHAYYQAGARVARHAHARPVLVYGVGGPCNEESDHAQVVKRRFTYHPAGYAHALAYEGPTHVVSFEISPGFFDRYAGDWPQEVRPLPALFYDDVWDVLLRVSEHDRRAAIDGAVEALATHAMAFLQQPTPAWILEVIDWVHANWRTVPSARDIARQFGVSPQHLTRSVRKWTGITLQQYALRLRLDYARGLLWGTGLSISQVAAETGFCDQSHLTRVLGSHSERTPSRLRRLFPTDGRPLRLPR